MGLCYPVARFVNGGADGGGSGLGFVEAYNGASLLKTDTGFKDAGEFADGGFYMAFATGATPSCCVNVNPPSRNFFRCWEFERVFFAMQQR